MYLSAQPQGSSRARHQAAAAPAAAPAAAHRDAEACARGCYADALTLAATG